MRFASDVIDLMGAYPGREFRMVQIVRYVTQGKDMDLRERRAARKAVLRVLEAFIGTGSILMRPAMAARGAPAFYAWKSET